MRPYIEEKDYQGTKEICLESRMLTEQRVFLFGTIDETLANDLVMQLMYLDGLPTDEPIRLYINSVGGEVISGLLIYDVLQSMRRRVEIYCTGIAASMAAILFASGAPGCRHILPHSKTMIHEPLIGGGLGGSATSIRNVSDSIMETKRILNEILAKHTGRTVEEIDEATAYDHYMDANASVEFGLCDDIVTGIR